DLRFASESSGSAWARFRLATEPPYASDAEPDWHTVIVRDRLALFVARYVTTGRLVHVIGWLTYRPLEARDGSHLVAEIRASDVLLLDKPPRPQSVAKPT